MAFLTIVIITIIMQLNKGQTYTQYCYAIKTDMFQEKRCYSSLYCDILCLSLANLIGTQSPLG